MVYHVDLLILKHSCIPGVTQTGSWCVLAALTLVDEAGNTWLEPELGVRHSFSWVQQLSPPCWEWDQVTRCREKALKVRSEMTPFATFPLSPVSAMAPCPLRRAALEQEGLKWAHVVSWRSTYWGCLGTPRIAPDLS